MTLVQLRIGYKAPIFMLFMNPMGLRRTRLHFCSSAGSFLV